jgi:hypothetical protein
VTTTHPRGADLTGNLRPLVALALVALIGLISAGCGSNTSSETGTAGQTGTAASKASTARDNGAKFGECMRRNGVSDFPDPDASGALVYEGSASSAVWQKAARACKELEPAGPLRATRSPKQQEEALKFAQCMRVSGVKDFPDPANDERLVDRARIPASGTPGGMTILNAAFQKCAVTPWEKQRGG